SFAADAYNAGTKHPAHSHDALHLSVVLSGRIAETVGKTTEHAGALSVVAKDSGVVHADDFGSAGARMARLELPRGTIAALIDDPSRSSGWRWTHDLRIANPFLRLVQRSKNGMSSFESDDPDLVDLLAAFTARPITVSRGTPPAWLQHTVNELRETWNPDLTVTHVARGAGVHPVYLARCFRRWFGLGVGEELRRLRLQSAALALTELDTTVSSVAHASGFADEPHLCRDFGQAAGITPGRYRALIRSLGYHRRGRSQ
ncbi:MAG TPA: AraC family transcriptional regulator, partial [Gemmatimonadaceae bacterium]|nr:AraC family transcriptional regulator [Gemmatimonadaceae bacterium]